MRPARLLTAFAFLSALAIAQTSSAPLTTTVFAGQAGTTGYADGTGTAARFYNPSGLVVDSKGNLFVADSANNTIRKITPAGVVTTFAGAAVDSNGNATNGGTADGTGADAQFNFGKSIIDSIGSNTLCIDSSDNIYVADTLNNSIRKITSAAVVTTLALKDSGGNSITLNSPDGVAIDRNGNLYVTDSGTNTVRKITSAGVTTVYAGTLNVAGSDDGTGSAVKFTNPRGIAIDAAGNVYVADTNNNTIRKVSTTGVVTTYAGSPGTAIRNSVGSSDGLGKNARFNGPIGLTVDAAGNVYVADRGNSSLRVITTAGVVSTVAGVSGTSGNADGTGNAARLNQPYSVATDSAGNIYVADTKNHVIRKCTVATSAPTVTISSQPLIQITHVGQSVTFSVTATGSSLSYQWKRGTKSSAGVNISGATSASYTLTSPALSDDSTFYSVVVTSGTVSFTSSSPELQVYSSSVSFPPIIMLVQPTDQTVTAGQGVTLSVEATGQPAPTYQWQKQVNGSFVDISGATSADFNIAAAQASDAGTYQCVLTAPGGTLTSNSASITVNAASTIPVVITAQPQSVTINQGQSATFSVTATGSPAPTYQWQKNGTDISGATSASFTVNNAQAADAANYRVNVTNAAGTVTSQTAALTVNITTPPPSDTGRLINLSILAPLAANETMTMGTVLGGAGTSGSKAVLARAAGPSLSQFGITAFLPNPTMTLNNTSASPAVVVATAGAWGGSATLSNAFTAVGAFPYTSASSKDSAIFQQSLATGNYTVQVTDTTGGSGTVITELYDSTPAASFTATTPRLINVSVLKSIATGTSLTTGFVIGGSTNLKVLVRAVGPTLGQPPFNIGGTMVDPKLELFNNATGAKINENNDWATPVAPLTTTSAQLTSTFTAVGAFQLANANTKDAVLLVTLPPGQYSARVSDANGGAGVVIVEVYEVP